MGLMRWWWIVGGAIIALAALLPAAVAADLPVTRQALLKAPIALSAAQTGQIIVGRRFFARPTNEKMGVRQQGLFCSGDDTMLFSQGAANGVMQNAGLILRRELDAAGYPPYVESAFQAAGAGNEIEYELAATLVGMQLNFCGMGSDVQGGVWLRIDWEMFSPRERRVVYRAAHEGSYQTTAGKSGSVIDLYRYGLTASVRNLLADPTFVEIATRRATGKPDEAAAALRIATRNAGGATALERMPMLQSAVVTVFSGAGSGSGFYISAEGYLLTNQHVVGDAKFVKIKLATGRELLGEVLRSVPSRDVALVKTEPVALAPMALAIADPRVGDEVHALGSPLGESLSGTVTRGVMSSFREIDQKRWLQSDVRILPGSSGGPLVGPDGAVIGIAAGGLAGGTVGVNLFIPIGEALAGLKVEFRSP